MSQIDIYKSAAIIINNKKLLVTRAKDHSYFVSPGGKIEGGETAKQALARELLEECSILVKEEDLEPFGIFSAPTASGSGKIVQIEAFTVQKFAGEIKPSHEVEEIKWIDSQTENIELGSIFKHEVMPKLKIQGLIN